MARSSRTRFAVCIDNSGYPASLELHKIYRVLPDKEAEGEGDIRIVDESGEDYLFEEDRFLPVDLPPKTVRVLNRSFARFGAEAREHGAGADRGHESARMSRAVPSSRGRSAPSRYPIEETYEKALLKGIR